MEALYLFKFLRPNNSQEEEQTIEPSSPITMFNKEDDFEEGDDSFFELELTSTLLHSDNNNTPTNPLIFIDKNNSSSNPISTRKVLPIETICKPQSPISLLKSAPKLKVLTFRKSKSTVESEEAEDFTVKPEKSTMGRYLKLIRRFYVIKKVKVFSREESSFGSLFPLASPLTVDSTSKKGSGIRNRLGRSKSSSGVVAAGNGSTEVRRRDDSLSLYYDGIQSAILHCKNSLNSSKDC